MAYPYESGYCQEGDVLLLMPNSEAYSKLTTQLTESAIADTAVEMDAILSRFYLTPVAGDPAALAILRVINKALARSYIGQIYDRSSAGDKPSGWHDMAYELLDQIVPPRNPDGTQPLPIIRFLLAPVQDPTELPLFPVGSGADFNDDNDSDLHPDQDGYFDRTGRTVWREGMM